MAVAVHGAWTGKGQVTQDAFKVKAPVAELNPCTSMKYSVPVAAKNVTCDCSEQKSSFPATQVNDPHEPVYTDNFVSNAEPHVFKVRMLLFPMNEYQTPGAVLVVVHVPALSTVALTVVPITDPPQEIDALLAHKSFAGPGGGGGGGGGPAGPQAPVTDTVYAPVLVENPVI